MELLDLMRQYGQYLAFFGDLEISDIENIVLVKFETMVGKSLLDGTSCPGERICLNAVGKALRPNNYRYHDGKL
jgi:hypothetical protein